MVNDKDLTSVLKLLPQKAIYYFCKANIPRALDENELTEQAKKFNLKGMTFSSVAKAFDKAQARAGKNDLVFINPEITSFSKDEEDMEEGCLSVPDYWVRVNRSKKIMIKATDENGNKFKFKAKGMLARILQHEYDHLQGVLIKDRVSKS